MGPSTLPESDYSRKLHVCDNTGVVHVVQCPLIPDGGGEVAPLLFVDHKAGDQKESDERQDEKDQHR